MSVWTPLVGQARVVTTLQLAVRAAGHTRSAPQADGSPGDPSEVSSAAMTHAWLFTGPPGSGRSSAARAFAAALQCESGGCGACPSCRTVAAGSHPDVEILATELLSIGVKDSRELVRRAALAPAQGRWQVIVCEDADRLTESAANVLLKAIEEPAPRTVWVLCAPSAEDVLPTLRSRCRHLHLTTPSADEVAGLLRSEGVSEELALLAAGASQGHIGRARRLASDTAARARRDEVLDCVARLRDVPACLRTAEAFLVAVKTEVAAVGALVDAAERDGLRAALGMGGPRDRQPPGAAGALKELEQRQRKRTTRAQRDGLDLALVDLVAFYRDVLAVQFGAGVAPVHGDRAGEVAELARRGSPEVTLRQIEAVVACRTALEANVAPLLAVETMTLALR